MNLALRTRRADRLYDPPTKRVSEKLHSQLPFPHSDTHLLIKRFG